MAKTKGKISVSQRLEKIRKIFVTKDEVSIESLAKKFNVSQMTIRRDLEKLESQGDVIRTHGGAALARKLTFEFMFRDRQHIAADRKSSIAEVAAGLADCGNVVFLDTGTTTLEAARKIASKEDICVITTSLAIVSQLQFADNIEVILLGGYLRPGSPDLHGPLTEQNTGTFHADIAFMGADSIDSNGNIYTSDLRVVNLDKKMAANADKVVILADSRKFSSKSKCKVLSSKDYDLIITDSLISRKNLNTLRRKNIKLIIA